MRFNGLLAPAMTVGVICLAIFLLGGKEPEPEPPPEPVSIQIGSVGVTFDNEAAYRHWQARMISDKRMAEMVYWLFELINEKEYQNIGEKRFNEFLLEVMAGAERRPYLEKKAAPSRPEFK